MADDGRSNRKARVIPFVNRLDQDRLINLNALVTKARTLELQGFKDKVWEDSVWNINDGRLVKLTGRHSKSIALNFHYPPKLGGAPISGQWADLAKSLLILRFHRKNQSAPNQRSFITAVAYVAYEALKQGRDVAYLTPEHLDAACKAISSHYSDSVAYNLHKAIGELAAHFDANRLSRIHLDYKFSSMKRPDSAGGLEQQRLDDPEVSNTKSDKLVGPLVFRVIGELFQKVPTQHKYRIYVLILTLLACLGRRFSEISLLTHQELGEDEEGRTYLEYFPRKASQGDVFTPLRRLYLPTEVVPIVREVFAELDLLCAGARQTATVMQDSMSSDLSFLKLVPEDGAFYKKDLKDLGIPPNTLENTGWLRQNGFASFGKADNETKEKQASYFTTKAGIIAFCQKDFSAELIAPLHIDQKGRKYFLKDLMIVKFGRFSHSGSEKPWIASQCTHSMMTTFLRYFQSFAMEFTSIAVETDFTSHHFRHTLNTLLDEGGLTELLQTEWFGRKNPRDTKAYQHTSREKRALMLREDIKKGLIGGQLAEQLKQIPVGYQDAFLKARVNAVHDVGAGLCVHNFVQTPCERHLQCSADCNDYVWAKTDKGRVDELKRQYAMVVIARDTAEAQSKEKKAKKSVDWLLHNEKKLKVLAQQLKENNVLEFNPYKLLEGLSGE